MRRLLAILFCTSVLTISCDHADHDHKGGHEDSTAHVHGLRGGHLLPLGSDAQIEFLHAKDGTKVSVFVYGTDGKTPRAIDTAPELKLTGADGMKILALTPEGALPSAVFTLIDPALGIEHLNGVLAVQVAGKTFTKDLEAFHDH